MKKLLSALALAVGIAGCGPNDTPVAKPGTMEALVEREIRKNDAWVESTIEGVKNNGSVALRRYAKERIKSEKDMGLIGASGYFDVKGNALLIPENENVFEVLDSIDHELSHAAFYNVLKNSKCKGPSEQEIADYCAKKTCAPEFDNIRKRLQLFDFIKKAELGIKVLDNYSAKEGVLDMRIEYVTTRMENSKNNIASLLTKEEKDAMSAVREKFSDMLKTAGPEYVALRKRCKEQSKCLLGEIRDEDLEPGIAAFEKICEDIKQLYKKLHSGLKEYTEKTCEYVGIADERSDSDMMKNMQRMKDRAKTEEEKNSLQKTMNILNGAKDVQKSMDHAASWIDNLEKLSNEIISTINTAKIENVLGAPTEVFARLTDSMYSIYFGPVEQSKFQLTEEDLKFLERFEFDGRKMFDKGISKYRLAMQMVKDGIAPESVKKQLEYATSFEYKGQKFSWPESRFRVKGDFPCEK